MNLNIRKKYAVVRHTHKKLSLSLSIIVFLKNPCYNESNESKQNRKDAYEVYH